MRSHHLSRFTVTTKVTARSQPQISTTTVSETTGSSAAACSTVVSPAVLPHMLLRCALHICLLLCQVYRSQSSRSACSTPVRRIMPSTVFHREHVGSMKAMKTAEDMKWTQAIEASRNTGWLEESMPSQTSSAAWMASNPLTTRTESYTIL